MAGEYTYDELATLVGRLKQSAIDARMCQGGQGYFSRSPQAEWQIAADKIHYERNGYLGDGSRDLLNPRDGGHRLTVSRPDQHGLGQGEQWEDGKFVGTAFKTEFDQAREAIKHLTDPWFDLPDPAKIGSVVDGLGRAYRDLLIDTAQINAAKGVVDEAGGVDSLRPSSNADLTGVVVTVVNGADYLHGTTARRFKTVYTSTVDSKIKNLGEIALELYAHALRQQAIWEGARKDVASILNQCLARFDAVAEGRSDDWTQELKILRVVNDMVGTVADGPVAGLVKQAGDYGLAAAESRQVHNGSPDTYDEVMVALRKSLDELNSEIRQQEDGIRRWAVDRLNHIWTDRGNYRLRGGWRGDELDPGNTRGAAALHFDEIDDRDEFRVGDDTAVKWDFTIAAEIVAGMEHLADLLDGIGDICHDPEVTEGVRSHVTRSPGVGVGGGYGPSQAVQQLNEALYDLLFNMAGDWRAGAENLRAASVYFETVEDGNVGQLDVLRQGIDAAADDVMDGTGIKVHDYRNISWWEQMGGR